MKLRYADVPIILALVIGAAALANRANSLLSSRQVKTEPRLVITGSNLTEVATSRYYFETNIPLGALSKEQANAMISNAFTSGFTAAVTNLIDSGGVRFSVTGMYTFAEGSTITVDRAYISKTASGTTGVLRADQSYVSSLSASVVTSATVNAKVLTPMTSLSAGQLNVFGVLQTETLSAEEIVTPAIDTRTVLSLPGSDLTIYGDDEATNTAIHYAKSVVIDGTFVSSGDITVDGTINRISSTGVNSLSLSTHGGPLGNELGVFRLVGTKVTPVAMATVLGYTNNTLTFLNSPRPVFFEWWPDGASSGLSPKATRAGVTTGLDQDHYWDTQAGDVFSFSADVPGYAIMRPGHPTDGLKLAADPDYPDVRYLGTNNIVGGVVPPTNAVFQASFVSSPLGQPYMRPLVSTIWTGGSVLLAAMTSGVTRIDAAFTDGWNLPYMAIARVDIMYPYGAGISDVTFFALVRPYVNAEDPVDLSPFSPSTPRYHRTSPTTGYIEYDIIADRLVLFQMRGAFGVSATMSLIPTGASIAPGTHTISVTSAQTYGGIATGGGIYSNLVSCTATATVKQGYSFVSWTEVLDVASYSPTYTFVVTNSRSLVANFHVNRYQLEVSSRQPLSGGASGGGSFDFNTACTVVATPFSGYSFANWSTNDILASSSASYSFMLLTNVTLVANFTTNQFTVTTEVSPTGAGAASGGGTVAYGALITLGATPNAGYQFSRWEVGGSAASPSNTFSFPVSSSRLMTAVFTPINYTTSLSVFPPSSGTVSGGGVSPYTSNVTVRATPSTGFSFFSWTDGGVSVTNTPTYTFVSSGNRALVATFATNSFQVSFGTSVGGTASGAGTFPFMSTATVVATAADKYTFSRWEVGNDIVSTLATYSFLVGAPRVLTPKFTPDKVAIQLVSTPPSKGYTTGGGTKLIDTECSVAAFAVSGHSFTNWVEAGSEVSTNATYTFTVTGARSLLATFIPAE